MPGLKVPPTRLRGAAAWASSSALRTVWSSAAYSVRIQPEVSMSSSLAAAAASSAASWESVNEARASARVAARAAEARSERSISRSIGECGDRPCWGKPGSGRSAGADAASPRAASVTDGC